MRNNKRIHSLIWLATLAAGAPTLAAGAGGHGGGHGGGGHGGGAHRGGLGGGGRHIVAAPNHSHVTKSATGTGRSPARGA